ncbi:hypothetical protein ACQKIC_02660 [Peribacillus sp. NPDC046944]|uniref:hypothetical protein n=1 Tax=Peribacillus sp. NPDC046944 TaxID=3390607 RepID=UPI003D032511
MFERLQFFHRVLSSVNAVRLVTNWPYDSLVSRLIFSVNKSALPVTKSIIVPCFYTHLSIFSSL